MRKYASLFSVIGVCMLYAACACLYFNHDLSYRELLKNYIPGQDGIQLVSANASAHPSILPWEQLEKNATLNDVLEKLCVEASLESDCYQDVNARFRLFTQEHRVEVSGTSYVLERNATPLKMNDITPTLLEVRIRLIAEWANANQRADGSFPYQYNPSTDAYPPGDYVLRDILTVQGFSVIADALHDEALRAVARRGEAYIFRKFYHAAGNKAYISDVGGDVPLGASALAILMIRSHSGNLLPSPTEKRLAEYILSMQRQDGSFQTFRDSATSTMNDKFFSGEALMALALLQRVSDDPRYGAALKKGFEYYHPSIENNFQPQYAPWHMQAYAIAYDNTHDEEYAQYVYWLADGLIETMLNHDRRALPDEVGRFYNPEYPDWGPPHSASTSIYLEGLTYAYQLAKEQNDEAKIKKYGDAMVAATRSLLLVQWTPESAYYLKHPERVVGSFKVTITDNRGRIDQTGHSANALMRVFSLLSER